MILLMHIQLSRSWQKITSQRRFTEIEDMMLRSSSNLFLKSWVHTRLFSRKGWMCQSIEGKGGIGKKRLMCLITENTFKETKLRLLSAFSRENSASASNRRM